jgi:hypothetical protein
MFSSIKERDWEFFSLATSAYHSFMGNSSFLPSHSSLLHKAHKLLKNFISSKLMSCDSGLRSWLRGGCCSSTCYCVNLAEGVDWKPGQRWLLLFCNILTIVSILQHVYWLGWSMQEDQTWMQYQFQAFLIGFLHMNCLLWLISIQKIEYYI